MTVQLLEETPAVLSLGRLCEDHGYSYELVSGHKPRLTKEGKTIVCKTDNFVPLIVPGLSTNSRSVSSSAGRSRCYVVLSHKKKGRSRCYVGPIFEKRDSRVALIRRAQKKIKTGELWKFDFHDEKFKIGRST